MTCKGICIRHKASGRYIYGNKRCQICDLFVQWDGIFCPCCGRRLRIGPRSFKFKAKLRKQKNTIIRTVLKERDLLPSPLLNIIKARLYTMRKFH
jgi:hypothetical protein